MAHLWVAQMDRRLQALLTKVDQSQSMDQSLPGGGDFFFVVGDCVALEGDADAAGAVRVFGIVRAPVCGVESTRPTKVSRCQQNR